MLVYGGGSGEGGGGGGDADGGDADGGGGGGGGGEGEGETSGAGEGGCAPCVGEGGSAAPSVVGISSRLCGPSAASAGGWAAA